jgi:hypothetical protein
MISSSTRALFTRYAIFLLLGGVLLFSAPALAQRASEGGKLNNYDYLNQELGHLRYGPPPGGSPFVLPQWALGTVTMRTGNVQRQQWLKYDLSTAQLLWRRPQGDSLELFTTLVREFTLRDLAAHQTHVYRLYPELITEQPLLRATFFDVRYDAGRSALLCQRKRQVWAQSSSAALNTTKKSEWSTTERFFVKRPDQTLVPIKLNNRSVVAALGEQHKASVMAYVSKERLNLSQEADVVRLLAYYDSLQP